MVQAWYDCYGDSQLYSDGFQAPLHRKNSALSFKPGSKFKAREAVGPGCICFCVKQDLLLLLRYLDKVLHQLLSICFRSQTVLRSVWSEELLSAISGSGESPCAEKGWAGSPTGTLHSPLSKLRNYAEEGWKEYEDGKERCATLSPGHGCCTHESSNSGCTKPAINVPQLMRKDS